MQEMSFGRVGEKSFFSYSKKEKSRNTKSKIFKVVTLYYFEMVFDAK